MADLSSLTLTRATTLEAIRSTSTGSEPEWDFLVVGGGATGLGTAVDAASRGHRVLLIEQADFAKATSSRSTKLVHGGVRYLKQGNISLVLEALHERGLLCRNANHLVHALSFVVPIYTWWEGPFLGIGLKVYDQMAGQLGLASSRLLSKAETLEKIPTVEPEGLQRGVIYYDGQFDDSRLAVNLMQTLVAQGGSAANYVACTGLVQRNGVIRGARLRDEESGEEWEVPAKCVINATGVFADRLRQMNDPETEAMIAPSQGVHLVLPKRFLPGESAIMVPHTADGRVLFAVPWHDVVVVGTTDTPRKQFSLEPRALPEEIDFLLEHAAKYLTQDPTPADVLSVFAGLRPLVGGLGSGKTAAISRDHTLLVAPSGLVTITGGKWTTYRKMAQDTIDQAELVAGLDRQACVTEGLRLQGALAEQTPPPTTTPEDPLAVYGSDAGQVKSLIQEQPSWASQLSSDLPFLEAQVVQAARAEMARTVEDVLARRMRGLLLNARASQQAAPRVAELLAAELGQDEAWQRQQVAAYHELADGYLLPST